MLKLQMNNNNNINNMNNSTGISDNELINRSIITETTGSKFSKLEIDNANLIADYISKKKIQINCHQLKEVNNIEKGEDRKN